MKTVWILYEESWDYYRWQDVIGVFESEAAAEAARAAYEGYGYPEVVEKTLNELWPQGLTGPTWER